MKLLNDALSHAGLLEKHWSLSSSDSAIFKHGLVSIRAPSINHGKCFLPTSISIYRSLQYTPKSSEKPTKPITACKARRIKNEWMDKQDEETCIVKKIIRIECHAFITTAPASDIKAASANAAGSTRLDSLRICWFSDSVSTSELGRPATVKSTLSKTRWRWLPLGICTVSCRVWVRSTRTNDRI